MLLTDGGVWANNPIGLAVVEALGTLGWKPNELSVLSIGCSDSHQRVELDRGIFRLSSQFARTCSWQDSTHPPWGSQDTYWSQYKRNSPHFARDTCRYSNGRNVINSRSDFGRRFWRDAACQILGLCFSKTLPNRLRRTTNRRSKWHNQLKHYITHEDVLEELANVIDIPDRLFEQVERHYKTIGSYLERNVSGIRERTPKVYPQGSFLLGTAIRPIGDADEYDIDLVCELSATKDDLSQKQLKQLVGQEVSSFANDNVSFTLDTEGRRCWTLEYAGREKFHIDILPSIPNANALTARLEQGEEDLFGGFSIAITDRTHPDYSKISTNWLTSNPRGFAKWFNSRQDEALRIRREKFLAEGAYAKVEDIPHYRVKTPLQQAIQLLKRHRDTHFKDLMEGQSQSFLLRLRLVPIQER